jgi:hypothetical protein
MLCFAVMYYRFKNYFANTNYLLVIENDITHNPIINFLTVKIYQHKDDILNHVIALASKLI